ncbi:MAG: hypothetical protein VX910_00800 [Candidatus Latescibacterota bacterium]|nr:hypothetical protein [Candidatus Latescibacterota bacterium]
MLAINLIVHRANDSSTDSLSCKITATELDLTEDELYGRAIQMRNSRIQEYFDPG